MFTSHKQLNIYDISDIVNVLGSSLGTACDVTYAGTSHEKGMIKELKAM